MPLVLADRVKETSTTTGNGTFTLAGASTGFQSFAVVGNNNTTYYTIHNPGTNEWEVGIGTYTSANTTIARTTILASSNSNNAVNFSAGTKDVFVTYPSEYAVVLNDAQTFTAAQSVVATTASMEALTVRGTTTNTSAFAVQRYSNDANPAELNLYKSRGATVGSNVRIQTSDVTGSINYYACGSNTGSYQIIAAIRAQDGTTTADDDLPGSLRFLVRTDGTSGTLTQRMVISSGGAVDIVGSLTSSAGNIIATAGYVSTGYGLFAPPAAAFINVGQATQWPAPTTGYTAGDMIYTQDAYYAVTQAGSPGYIPTYQSVYLADDFTLQAASGVQACLTAANDTLTIAAATTYEFEGQYIINTGSTTHTTAMAFALGSNATVSSFEYTTILWSAALNTIATAASFTQVSGVASKVLNATSTAVYTMIKFKGVMRTTLGGTITPQIAFSANPTGTNRMKKGSFIKFTPVGADTVEPIGLWA
jgi:hypothetical protein